MKLSTAAKILFITKALSYPTNLIATQPVAELPDGGFDVLLRGGEELTGVNQYGFLQKRGCTVQPQLDGNLSINNGFLVGGFDSNQNSLCDCITNPQTTFRLQHDGNLVAKCGEVIDYSTHTSDGPDVTGANYFLAIDNKCVLHIYKGTVTSDSVTVEKEVWRNVKKQIGPDERLGQGEQVYFKEDGFVLVLQSNDGNLVLYDGYSDENPLWGAMAQDNFVAPDTSCSGGRHDFFAKVHPDGRLTLKVVGSDQTYLDYDLQSNGAEDFTVGYMVDPSSSDYILVAMCDGTPCKDLEDRNLRCAA